MRHCIERQPREFAAAGLGDTLAKVQDNLKRIRKTGWDQTTGEVTQGITGIAAPIFGERDKVLGSLSISFPARNTNAKRIVSIAERVVACAAIVTKAISQPAGTARTRWNWPKNVSLTNPILWDLRKRMETQVLIAGAGPTGLTLAVDLGMRGIRCVLIEQKEAPLFLPKMERSNARSHGDLPAHGAGGPHPRGRASGRRADGRVHRAVERRRAAAAAQAVSVGARR